MLAPSQKQMTTCISNLTFDTTATPQGVFKVFSSPVCVGLARSCPMMNGYFERKGKKLRIHLQTHPKLPNTLQTIPWEEISCDSVSTHIKASPCTTGSQRNKVFYKKAKTLGDYIVRLDRREISVREHSSLFKFLFEFFPRSFINHNFDVNTLHFKQA